NLGRILCSDSERSRAASTWSASDQRGFRQTASTWVGLGPAGIQTGECDAVHRFAVHEIKLAHPAFDEPAGLYIGADRGFIFRVSTGMKSSDSVSLKNDFAAEPNCLRP